jgi:hypothetical protein
MAVVVKVHQVQNPYRTRISARSWRFAAFVDIGTAAELTNIGTCLLSHWSAEYPCSDIQIPIIGRSVLRLCRNTGARNYHLHRFVLSLPLLTWIRFGVWFVLGCYHFSYSRKHSLLRTGDTHLSARHRHSCGACCRSAVPSTAQHERPKR